MNYTIKSLNPEYEAFMWELLYKNIFVAHENGSADREIEDLPELKNYIQHWGEYQDDVGFIALDENNQPVGAVWTRLFNEDDQMWGFVDNDTPEMNISILDSHRGKGLGSRLLISLFEELKTKYSQVSISAHPDNRCVVFYKRNGFEIYEEYDNALTLVKKL